MGLGLVKVRLKVRFKVSIGGRVRVSFFGSFRVRVRGGVRVRFWLGPGTRLDPIFFRQDRQLQSITITRHLYAVALRFVYRNGPPGEIAASAALDTIRNVRGQCERTDRVGKLNEKEGIGCEKKHNVVYTEILQLCRDLVSAFEE